MKRINSTALAVFAALVASALVASTKPARAEIESPSANKQALEGSYMTPTTANVEIRDLVDYPCL